MNLKQYLKEYPTVSTFHMSSNSGASTPVTITKEERESLSRSMILETLVSDILDNRLEAFHETIENLTNTFTDSNEFRTAVEDIMSDTVENGSFDDYVTNRTEEIVRDTITEAVGNTLEDAIADGKLDKPLRESTVWLSENTTKQAVREVLETFNIVLLPKGSKGELGK